MEDLRWKATKHAPEPRSRVFAKRTQMQRAKGVQRDATREKTKRTQVSPLTWEDVNWEKSRIRVPSPKTEHHEDKGSRTIPLFPELKPHLLEAFEQAEPGTRYVITRYRDGSANLRTQLQRIIRQAGLEPWPKPFQNLRSTRQTELAECFPMHAVCKWIGNSQPVASEHYLQVTDEHFERAIGRDDEASAEAAHKAAQKLHETARNDSKPSQENDSQLVMDSGINKKVPAIAGTFLSANIPPTGLEPVSPG